LKPLLQQCVAHLLSIISHRNGQRLLRPQQHHQLLAPRDACVEEVPLKEDVVLHEDGHHHGGIFGALRLVHGRGIGEDKLVQVREVLADELPVKVDIDLLLLPVDPLDPADITVVHILVVVVFDLHHLVACLEGLASPQKLVL